MMMFGGVPISVAMPPRIVAKLSGINVRLAALFAFEAVWTSTGMYCLGGITRGNVIECCREAGIPVFENPFSLHDVYTAEEAFVTGTFAGLTPVREVDGRVLGPVLEGPPALPGPVVSRLRGLYAEMQAREAEGRDG